MLQDEKNFFCRAVLSRQKLFCRAKMPKPQQVVSAPVSLHDA
jgi:hypothetical protein